MTPLRLCTNLLKIKIKLKNNMYPEWEMGRISLISVTVGREITLNHVTRDFCVLKVCPKCIMFNALH